MCASLPLVLQSGISGICHTDHDSPGRAQDHRQGCDRGRGHGDRGEGPPLLPPDRRGADALRRGKSLPAGICDGASARGKGKRHQYGHGEYGLREVGSDRRSASLSGSVSAGYQALQSGQAQGIYWQIQ